MVYRDFKKANLRGIWNSRIHQKVLGIELDRKRKIDEDEEDPRDSRRVQLINTTAEGGMDSGFSV